jgi:hypothetical protein
LGVYDLLVVVELPVRGATVTHEIAAGCCLHLLNAERHISHLAGISQRCGHTAPILGEMAGQRPECDKIDGLMMLMHQIEAVPENDLSELPDLQRLLGRLIGW